MTDLPQNAFFTQGHGAVSAANLNAMIQAVPNSAALLNLVGANDIVIYLEGYVTPGDGGQGNFFWNAAATGETDGLTIFKPYGVVGSGAWVRLPDAALEEDGPAEPLIRGTKSWATTWAAAITAAQDISEMVGYAAYAGTTGGNGQTVYYVWNASGDASVVGSLPYAVAESAAGGGGLIVVNPYGTFDIVLTEPLASGPNTTIAAPGRNCRLFADNTLTILAPTGTNNIFKWLSVLRPPSSAGGDGFTYGAGYSPPGASPISLGTGNGTTTTFTVTTPVPPIRPYLVTVINNGAVVANDITTGTINSDGIKGTINFATGALSTTFTVAPTAGTAIQAQYYSTTNIGTGNGTTSTFTGTISTSSIPGTIFITVGTTVLGGDNGTGTISGPGVTGTVNYTTGAVSITCSTPPASGAAVTVSYYLLVQYGTGNGTTTTFSTTLTGPFNNGYLKIYINGVGAAGLVVPSTGTIAGTGITGTVNYGTGAISVTWTTAPVSGAVLQVGYASSGLSAGDNFHLDPTVNDKTWVYQCTTQFGGDGLLDIASSGLQNTTSPCRITVQNNIFRWHDKATALGGDLQAYNPTGTPPVLLVTWAFNVSDGVASRSPRIGPLTFVHSFNNLHIMAPHIRPDGTYGSITGIEVGNPSGLCLSENDLFIPAYNTSIYPVGVAAAYNFNAAFPGALKLNGAVALGGLSLIPGNQSYVPTPPYTYTTSLVPTPDTLAFGTYVENAYANAGAERSPLSELDYTTLDLADSYAQGYLVDGYNVVANFDVNGNLIGVLIRTFDPIEATTSSTATDIELPVQTVTLAGGIATINISDNLYKLAPSSGTSGTVTNIVTDGTFSFANGQIIKFQPSSSSNTITFSAAGIGSPGCILTPGFSFLMSGEGGWVYLQYSQALNSGLGAFSPVNLPLQPSGAVWTPTFTTGTNCASATLVRALYIVQGSVVTCFGSVTVTATAGANTATTFNCPVPVLGLPANSALTGQLVGDTGTAMVNGIINGSGAPGSPVALFKFYAPSTSAITYDFLFSYSSL